LVEQKKPSILVVDDESNVRDLIELMLAESGYPVHTAASGREAIQIASDLDNPIDILVTDILMPYMNGKELATRISSMRPYIKVLFVSAYSADILANNNMFPKGADFIRKPFDKHQLLSRIEKIVALSLSWPVLVSRSA
jgi:two-component system cell cycle sensor histidine kinase/response regulator CckA